MPDPISQATYACTITTTPTPTAVRDLLPQAIKDLFGDRRIGELHLEAAATASLSSLAGVAGITLQPGVVRAVSGRDCDAMLISSATSATVEVLIFIANLGTAK